MSFSVSTFTVEVDGQPVVVFQAKLQSEAEDLCRHWTSLHPEAVRLAPLNGIPVTAHVKVRLARSDEREVFERAQTDAVQGTMFVPLAKR